MVKDKRVGVISLGCDKNRVDTEKMLAFLRQKHQIVGDIRDAEIIIINTCAFLQSSREEALNEIFSANEIRKSGNVEKIIVTGCLPQKFIDEIFEELYEVDAFLGVSDYDKILDVIDILYSDNKRVNAVGKVKGECGTDRILTTNNFAYLKIADGCSNHCTYCLIPYIRGKYRSVEKEDLVEETKKLGSVKELILVAQDTARYGQDLEKKTTLTELIKELSKIETVGSIRLLYCYPENISDDLINEFKTNDKLIKYIDMPLQHADNGVLKRMNRKGTGEGYLNLIKRLKREVEGIAIRSTFITGFPGESEEAFNNLKEFIKKAELFNCGFFKYSREEGTPAYKLNFQIEEKIKNSRLRKLYTLQKQVVNKNLKKLVGTTVSVLAEGFDYDKLVYYGRAYFNAPDIDGKVYFFSAEEVKSGEYLEVLIKENIGYDLFGERL